MDNYYLYEAGEDYATSLSAGTYMDALQEALFDLGYEVLNEQEVEGKGLEF